MSNDASSNDVNDRIIRLFLYGNENGPTGPASEALIRASDDVKTFFLPAIDFKDGPGRFAKFRGHNTN